MLNGRISFSDIQKYWIDHYGSHCILPKTSRLRAKYPLDIHILAFGRFNKSIHKFSYRSAIGGRFTIVQSSDCEYIYPTKPGSTLNPLLLIAVFIARHQRLWYYIIDIVIAFGKLTAKYPLNHYF